MSYLLFCVVLIASGCLFAILRLFIPGLKFEKVFVVLGHAVVFLPVAVMIYMVMLVAAALPMIVIAIILHIAGQDGLLSSSDKLAKVWLVCGPFLLYGLLHLHLWHKERSSVRDRDRRAETTGSANPAQRDK